ncbi:MAG: acriflavin resistance protein [Gammaproteobacteria bacterium 39-13]|mgnify:CR=1 FL=1|nr:efflux RND transporter permease subunit [Gammaproteobacteria bacterium]OJV90537.1 MAG: acriflavin resistance protein [Gammaproteobacteria bacterium 39-13]
MNEVTNEGESKKARLVHFAIENPHFVIVACLIVTILGALSLIKLPKDLLPAANLPAVQVLSLYPGMPVKAVEQNLSAIFEQYTGQAIGIERQESKSLMGVSIVRNFFNSNADLNTSITQTTALVMSALRKLPPGTQPPLILPFDPMAAIPLALVAVSADKPIQKVYDKAYYDVRYTLQAVPEAIVPTVMGGTPREVIIYLDPAKMKEYNFSLLSVLDTIKRLNSFIPVGDIKIGDYDYQMISDALPQKISDMNHFPLRAEYGVTVQLNQVGEALDAHQIQTNVVLVDGKEQVYVPIYRQPGGNSLQVVENVKASLKKISATLPEFHLNLVADQSFFIRKAIDSITEEALLGGGLAALMIFLFLGNPRATFGILLSLPLALLGAFIGLYASGQTINAMTLGGLALSIGVLVDNSIVVLENISKKLELGLTSLQSALIGASEVAMPVFIATTSTLVVLFPVVFLSGMVKILFAALAKSVLFIMISSYMIAMTVMPLFASCLLKPISITEKKTKFDLLSYPVKAINKLTFFYGRALFQALHHRKIVFAVLIFIFLVGALLIPKIGIELFPTADAGNITLTVRLPSGTRIEKTKAFSIEYDKKLREWILPSDLKMIIVNAGVYYGFSAAFTPNSGTMDAFFNIELTPDRKHTSQYYAKLIRENTAKEYPDIEVAAELGGLLSSALSMGRRAPINVQIHGPHLEESHKIAQGLVEKIKNMRGAVDVRIQERFNAPMIFISVDREKAMRVGIETTEIVKNVASAVTGSSTFDSSNIWVDPETGFDYFLGVQYKEDNISSLQALEEVSVIGRDRERPVPLKNIATLSKTTGPTQLDRVNLKPVINIYLDAQDRDMGGLSNEIQALIDKTEFPPNYYAQIGGEIAEMNKSIQSLAGGFILATILVYLILVIQFRSFLLPLIIMVSVPLGLIGIVIMLALTHTYFSIQAAIGAIFMIGIAVANGVLLIEFMIHHTRKNGQLIEGIVMGASARFRPILMTSLAAILGLIPMAIGLGHGSEANIPLGRAVIGGQSLSMILTLFIVPILYYYATRKKLV